MRDGYSLSASQARVCRVAAGLFLAAAAVQALALLLSWLSPEAQVTLRCAAAGCESFARPEAMLPGDLRAAVAASPDAMQRFIEYVRAPVTRIGLALLGLIGNAPIIALMLSVAAAMRRLAMRDADALAGALPWIRRASIAALFMALMPPVVTSLRVMLLMPGTPHGPGYYFALDLAPLLFNVLVAFAAFIVAWALAAGSRATRDMSEFV